MKINKPILFCLIGIFLALQYEFWFATGGVFSAFKMDHAIKQQQQADQKLEQRNQAITADINQLKDGKQAVEQRARTELGMVRKGETFYQVVKKKERD